MRGAHVMSQPERSCRHLDRAHRPRLSAGSIQLPIAHAIRFRFREGAADDQQVSSGRMLVHKQADRQTGSHTGLSGQLIARISRQSEAVLCKQFESSLVCLLPSGTRDESLVVARCTLRPTTESCPPSSHSGPNVSGERGWQRSARQGSISRLARQATSSSAPVEQSAGHQIVSTLLVLSKGRLICLKSSVFRCYAVS